jgi:DNA-binding NarL/FixJ family response regulator
MPPGEADDGVRAARTIRAELPNTGVLVLSQYIVERAALDLIADSAEGVGYLLKRRVSDLDRFVDAVRRVGEGGSALDPEVVARLLGRSGRVDPLETLTAREREVLAWMAEGVSNRGIAEALVITEHAVEQHIGGILGKLGIDAGARGHRRVLAVLAYLRGD